MDFVKRQYGNLNTASKHDSVPKSRNVSARSILASGSKAYDGRTDGSGSWMKKLFAVWL
jgi:hypothetical protein